MPLLAPGQRAWAVAATVLPQGLAHESPVKILGPVPGSWSTYVEEVATGRVFELGRENIDNGWEFEVSPNRWIPEHHPKILDHLEVSAAQERAEAARMPDFERRNLCFRAAAFYDRVLRRNGRIHV